MISQLLDIGLEEIISLHRKWEIEEMKNVAVFQNRLRRGLCF